MTEMVWFGSLRGDRNAAYPDVVKHHNTPRSRHSLLSAPSESPPGTLPPPRRAMCFPGAADEITHLPQVGARSVMTKDDPVGDASR